MRAEATGVDIPSPFDTAVYDRVSRYSAHFEDSHFGAWRSFVAAWNAISFRQRAAHDYNAEFTAAVRKTVAPGGDARYRQDHAMFGFTVSQLSAFECLYFGVYCISSIRLPEHFPIGDAKKLRDVNPRKVSGLLSRSFPDSTIAKLALSTLDSDVYTDLSKLRNYLSHRGMLPRETRIGGAGQGTYIARNPTDPTVEWVIDRPINDSSFGDLYTSAMHALNGLVTAVDGHLLQIIQLVGRRAT